MSDDDQRFFREEVTQFYNELLNTVANASGDRLLAADIVQETMRVAWEKLERIRTYDDIRSAMIVIARNELANYYRKNKRELKNIPCEEPENGKFCAADCLDAVLRKETQTEFLAKIERMTKKNGQILLLHYYGGLSFCEIAERLDCNYNTVVARHRRALKQLGKELGEFRR